MLTYVEDRSTNHVIRKIMKVILSIKIVIDS